MSETARQRQKRQTRENILRCAAEQFALHGFLVPTADIAKAAGLSHGAVFLHFSTREELTDFVIDRFFEQLNGRMHTAVKKCSGVAELLAAHLSVLEAHEPLYRQLVTQLPQLPDHTREKLFAHQSTLSFHFAQVFSGEAAPDKSRPVPFHMLFNLWIALVHYYLQNGEMFAPGESVLGHCKEELVEGYTKLIGL